MKNRIFGVSLFDLVPALAGGLLLTASFPKLDYAFFAWVAFIPLFFAIKDREPLTSFSLGILTGVVHYSTLLYWIAGVISRYGQLPGVLAVIILLSLVLYLSLYLGFFAMMINRLSARSIPVYLAAPFLWVTLEYIKSFFLTGFPWENLGYSQYNWLRLIQISDMFGVYGISALIMAANGALFEVLYGLRRKRTIAWKPVCGVIIILAGFLAYGSWRIESLERVVNDAPKRRVAVVQGNIDQSLKWLPSYQHETLRQYGTLSAAALKEKPDLIIWPETALPFYFLYDEDLTGKTVELIRHCGVYFVLGSPSLSRVEQQTRYYNSAYLLAPGGNVEGKYDKVHLVPYGEYVPLKRYFPFMGKVVQAVGDFHSGERGQVLSWENNKIGVLICFEVIFPDLARAMVQRGAQLLINMTNDAWFGRSSAPYQHLSMVVFRAVECRRALARAANTGVSAFVDPIGRLLDETPIFEKAFRTRALPIMNCRSLYVRYGDIFALACSLVSLVAYVISFGREQEG